jgi:class 3 adenylate cyclase
MRRTAFTGLLLAVPVAGLFLLLGVPDLDVTWEHQPSHFWLVLVSALLSFLLGFLMAEAAARRGDARVLLVALAFLAASGFLALHALATPGVLLAGKNAGFQIASAIGLLIASGFAGASALPLGDDWARAVLRERRLLLVSVGVAIAVWAVLALGTLPPLDEAITPEAARGPLLVLWAVGMLFYGYAAFRFARLYARRRAPVALAVASAWVLLAEAMLAVAVARNWHVSWWEWHLLMLLAFALVARSVWAEWKREGSSAEIFADLYEERTLGREEELSVLFADLQGFTTFAERTPPDEVRAMLDANFSAATPVIEDERGELVQTVGDALFAIFRGEEHETRAARAALRLQQVCAALPGRRPDWPRFRVGVNSGEVHAGLVGGASGHRKHGIVGDVVNLAARLQSEAPVGGVLIDEETFRRLGARARVEPLPPRRVKGKDAPVTAYILLHLDRG